ncbi:MAG: hypothetical protein CEN87_559 [Parcubacteria group bacterium Licking1014_1]|nr:MAG: hypothetical protein CEN87_559 [Parcubacteria group bacterium Licking1014_1]
MDTKKFLIKYGIWLIFLIFLLATFNFLYKESFDNQEIDYLKISQWNVKKIIFENWGDQLPFWFILAKTYIGFLGKSELSLKILSIATFLLSAFVLYKICEIYGLNKYLVTALFLFNPLLLKEAAFTFKHWSFLILMILSVLYLFEKFKNTQNKKYLFLLFPVIIAGMYSNLIFLIFFCAFAVYMLINLLSEQISLRFFIFFIIASIAFSLPLFYYYEKASHQLFEIQGSHMDWGTAERGFDFIKISLDRASGINYLNDSLSVILVFLIFLFFILQFFLEREKKFINLKIWLISTVFFIMLVLMFMAANTPISPRYYAAAVPFLYLAIFPKSDKKYVLVIAILILSITVFSSWQMIKNHNPDNWRGVSSFLQPQIKENTQILILYKFNVGNLLMEYYLKKPVTRLPDLENSSILYSDDIWIIAQPDSYGAIYKTADDYNIKEHNNFKPIKLFHLTKKNPKKNSSLIFNNPLIEIEKNKKIKKIEFTNGAIGAWSFPEDYWKQIKIKSVKSGGVEKTCLFVHPRNNEKINIIYKNIEFGKTVKIFTGIADGMTGENLSPVYMDVYINDIFLKRITQPDEWNWLITKIDTSQYQNKSADIKFTIYADNDKKRHFCFDAEITDENDYFYQNIKNANALVDNELCKIYQTKPIFPHNEKKPPFVEAAIFERWDCEEDLISKNKIWNTSGKSYAISDNKFKEAIWFHPTTGKIKTLEYKNINLEAKKITGFYGLNDLAISNKIDKAMLTFTISANGEKIYEDKFIPVKGWKKFEIPFNPVRNSMEIKMGQFNGNKISNGVNKKLNDVVFSITTDDNRWNHFFFNAFLENSK